MLVGIIGDPHLGERRFHRTMNGKNYWEQILYHVWNEAVQHMIRRKVDLVLIPGDLFDKPNPDVTSLVMANRGLADLAFNINNHRVAVISGNHEMSRYNEANEVHPFDLLGSRQWLVGPADKGVHSQILKRTALGWSDTESDEVLERLLIQMAPYDHLHPSDLEQLRQYKDTHKGEYDHSLLMIHGSVVPRLSYGEDGDPCNEYELLQSVAMQYDMVVAGHVHLPSVSGNKKHRVLVPGSVMPSAASFDAPGDNRPRVWFWDTVSGEVQKESLNAPMVFVQHTEDADMALQSIIDRPLKDEEPLPINVVVTPQRIGEVDMDRYKRAWNRSLYLSMITAKEVVHPPEVTERPMPFWDWVDKQLPDEASWLHEIVQEART